MLKPSVEDEVSGEVLDVLTHLRVLGSGGLFSGSMFQKGLLSIFPKLP